MQIFLFSVVFKVVPVYLHSLFSPSFCFWLSLLPSYYQTPPPQKPHPLNKHSKLCWLHICFAMIHTMIPNVTWLLYMTPKKIPASFILPACMVLSSPLAQSWRHSAQCPCSDWFTHHHCWTTDVTNPVGNNGCDSDSHWHDMITTCCNKSIKPFYDDESTNWNPRYYQTIHPVYTYIILK